MIAAYERDPSRIYAESFRLIAAEASVQSVADEMRAMAIRLVHACGMPDIIEDLRWSDSAVTHGQDALRNGAAIFCDAEMVARGVNLRALPQGTYPIVTLNRPEVEDCAKTQGMTRSAAAVDLWDTRLAGAVVAIGNAPTALFRLLERVTGGGPRPALILGFPVGFVGAAESKMALATLDHGVPYVTLLGRRGGSAMAAAAVNALTLGLDGDGIA
ncbi:MAG: precorrin-8X methylmutase [Pseudomonadota bacterium]